MRGTLFVLLFLFCTLISVAQTATDKQYVKRIMNQAKKEMKSGQYESANRSFRKLLDSHKVLPNELSYLFAETLYMIGQFENSHNFLNKYVKLTGKAGDYYEESLQLEELLKVKLNQIKSCQLCDNNGYTLITCRNCNGEGHEIDNCHYCKASGISSCLVCLGEGVIITTTTLNDRSYKSCHNCQSKGHVTCPVCDGNKQIDHTCNVCLGTKKESTKSICLHPNL